MLFVDLQTWSLTSAASLFDELVSSIPSQHQDAALKTYLTSVFASDLVPSDSYG